MTSTLDTSPTPEGPSRTPPVLRTRKQIQTAAMADQSAQRLKWKAMVPAAHSTWSKLETQELAQLQGNVHRLAGLIQLRYRTSREEADQQVAAFLALNP